MSASDATSVATRPLPAGPRRLLSDERLARLAASGDTAAFETIFSRHHQAVYRYCRAIVGSEQDAEDALQSTMAAALRALPGESRDIALRPWLFRVAHNEAISIVRRRETPLSESEPVDRAIEGVEVEVESRHRLRQLVADLRSLPDRQRSALVMRELSGLDYDAIGAALEATPAAARQTVYEARVALADLKEGREMDCEFARLAISQRDGRILRGRRLRSHLRGCEACRDFKTGISTRRADLAALCPPLPVLAASGIIAGIVGGSGGGGGAGLAGTAAAAGAKGASAAGAGAAAGTGGGAGIGGVLGASAGLKAASVVAAVAVGAGAASATGVLDVPVLSGSTDNPSASSSAPVGAPSAQPTKGANAPATEGSKARGESGSSPSARSEHAANEGARSGHGQRSGQGHGHSGGQGRALGTSHGEGSGNSASGPPAAAGSPSSTGNGSGNAYGHSHSNAGGSSTGLSHRSTHSSAGGSSNAGGGSSSHAASSGHSTGQPAAPPGQTKPPHAHAPAPKPSPPPKTPPGQGGSGGTGSGTGSK